jgi:hypothetical protein
LRTLRPPSAHALSRAQISFRISLRRRASVEGRGSYCLNIGGVQIDEAVTRAFIAALEPAKIRATAAAEQVEMDRGAALKHWRLSVERASYAASLAEERDHLSTLGRNLAAVWTATTTTPRDRKELLGSLIEEVIVNVERDKCAAHLMLRWKGGALTEIGPAALAACEYPH